MKRSTVVRISIFLATVVASWAVLSLGTLADEPDLEVGFVGHDGFTAEQPATVVDTVETERLRQEARDSIKADPPRKRNTEIENSVAAAVSAVFDDAEALAVGDVTNPLPEVPSLPEPPEETTTTQGGDSSSTTTPGEPALITGSVYIDADGNSLFSPNQEATRTDRGLGNLTVTVTTFDGETTVMTDDLGAWSFEFAGGPAVIEVDVTDADLPRGYVLGTGNHGQLIECEPGETCATGNVGFVVNPRPVEAIAGQLRADHGLLEETATYLAAVAVDDLRRFAFGEPLHLQDIRQRAEDAVILEFARNILPGEQEQEARAAIRANPPRVAHIDTGFDEEGSAAAGDVVATNLRANYLEDEQQTAEDQEAAAARVMPVEEDYVEGQAIVAAGVPLSQLHIDAIEATSVPTLDEQPSAGLMAVVAVLVALLALYLARFRPEFWARPRMVALVGIMIVLAAASVRGTVAVHAAFENQPFSWYVLPAVAFGFVTAVLFDQRIAVLMALAVGVLAAVGTLDTGVTVYASLAALAPIPFVSSLSTRGSFRSAVIFSGLVAAAVAASTSWFFHVGPQEAALDVLPQVLAWAFGVSVVASLVGLAALQFFESAFDITTALGLLDLTDRNHRALQMLQDKAFGTFNHSLMVGTLADAAARAIGANALLARAMAYYHDLGKTENPTYFIENQFGMSNPHDSMDPRESAEMIRSHVSAGVALAREYKIPTEVTEGIVSHHGDGVMRYFYEKAREIDGADVEIDDFRHIGHKPRTAETAILMLADALEASCRAVFQSEEPSPDAIEKVVDRIVDEKVEDGQLSESPLTLAQLNRIRRAFLDSLIGHYHQRIAYPNFPGS